MNKRNRYYVFFLTFIIVLVSSCKEKRTVSETVSLKEIARSERLWTGVAVSDPGRIFVNYPRWTPVDTFSVCEILTSGEVVPYPDRKWNRKDETNSSENYFICVQSVYRDRDNYLWILDTGLDVMTGIVPGGAKLLKVDPNKNQVIQKIIFPEIVTPAGCYLNDVRVDTRINYAYITDSGLGGIIIVNLSTENSRRILSDHFSVKAEDVLLKIEGKDWLSPNGSRPQIHSDGLALSPDGKFLYFQALTGKTMYRIKTKYLRDSDLQKGEIGKYVEKYAESGASDGLVCDEDGKIYLTSLEFNAIRRVDDHGNVETVIHDSQLKWPDSFSLTNGGELYVTTSQLHLGSRRTEPYKIFKIKF